MRFFPPFILAPQAAFFCFFLICLEEKIFFWKKMMACGASKPWGRFFADFFLFV